MSTLKVRTYLALYVLLVALVTLLFTIPVAHERVETVFTACPSNGGRCVYFPSDVPSVVSLGFYLLGVGAVDMHIPCLPTLHVSGCGWAYTWLWTR